MLKKIVLGTLFVGLIGALVIGAVNRTSARSESSSEADRATVTTTGSNGQSNRGQGLGRSTDQGSVVEPIEVTEWVTASGTVTHVTTDEIAIQTADGQEVTVDGRPWSYAQEQQFGVQVGDRVRLHGFYEGEELEVGKIENQRSGAAVQLRDTSGRPLWSGRGRQAQTVDVQANQ